MRVKGIIDVDFQNYKKPSLYIAFPSCSFKCGKLNCQNSTLPFKKNIDVKIEEIINLFDSTPITEAVVCGGLEPIDSWEDLQSFIINFRHNHADDIVIYTGYNEDEIEEQLQWLKLYENIIIKFGRYIPNKHPKFDKNLGVELASGNQYSKVYNKMEGYC